MNASGEFFPLSPQQEMIVMAPPDQPQLVVAPPGAGKTHIVVGRIQYLIDTYGISPSELLVLCFTRTAVAEITRRLKYLVKKNRVHDDLRFVSVRTFDSFATRMLLAADSDGDLSGFSYDARIDLAIETLMSSRSDASVLISNFKHLIVDEIQDLVGVRARLVQILIERVSGGFTLLGDPAQAIYNFADNPIKTGEKSINVFDWVRRQEWFSGVLERTLSDNYRSNGKIIQKVSRIREELLSNTSEDEIALDKLKIFVKRLQNAGSGIEPKLPEVDIDESLCVLCRSNGEVLQLASLFAQKGVRFIVRPRPEDSGLPSWLGRVFGSYANPKISLREFECRWNTLIGEAVPIDHLTAWDWLKKIEEREKSDLDIQRLHLQLLRGKNLPDDLDAYVQAEQNGVALSTIHAVKGREFDQVVILQPDENNYIGTNDYVEEARVLYVAATRARKEIANLGRNGLPQMWKVECENNRSRWIAHQRKSGYYFMEMGLAGDIDATSFVNKYLFASQEDAASNQNFLWKNVQVGDVAQIKKIKRGHYTFFRIFIENENFKDPILVGQLSLNFKKDLSKVLGSICGERYYYPYYMKGIRVAALVTELLPPFSENSQEPFAASRFCIGLRLRGMGYIYKEAR